MSVVLLSIDSHFNQRLSCYIYNKGWVLKVLLHSVIVLTWFTRSLFGRMSMYLDSDSWHEDDVPNIKRSI